FEFNCPLQMLAQALHRGNAGKRPGLFVERCYRDARYLTVTAVYHAHDLLASAVWRKRRPNEGATCDTSRSPEGCHIGARCPVQGGSHRSPQCASGMEVKYAIEPAALKANEFRISDVPPGSAKFGAKLNKSRTPLMIAKCKEKIPYDCRE